MTRDHTQLKVYFAEVLVVLVFPFALMAETSVEFFQGFFASSAWTGWLNATPVKTRQERILRMAYGTFLTAVIVATTRRFWRGLRR